MKASTSEGSPSSDGAKSRTGGLRPGMNTLGSGRVLGLTTFAMTPVYRNREPAAGLAPWPTPLSNPMPAPSPPSERHYRQGRQGDRDGVLAAVLGHGPRRNQPPVAYVRSPEHLRIRVQDLFVKALLRHPELVALARHGGEVAAEEQKVFRVRAAAQERNDGVIPIVEVHPLEAGVMKIDLVERGAGAVQPVQLPHQRLELTMQVEFHH